MFQGPKGYIAQYVKYTCSMETVQQNGRFTLFLVISPLTYILFSMNKVLNVFSLKNVKNRREYSGNFVPLYLTFISYSLKEEYMLTY